MSAIDTDLDLEYFREETIRIVNDYARRDEIDSDQVTWLARAIAELTAEIERILINAR